jgi:hypothetical protein
MATHVFAFGKAEARNLAKFIGPLAVDSVGAVILDVQD